MSLQAIKYERGQLQVLDQLLLPHEFLYFDVTTCEGGFDAIKDMKVRGAPAIALVASLSLGVELVKGELTAHAQTASELSAYIDQRLEYLKGSRPTAVDLANACRHLSSVVRERLDADANISKEGIINAYVEASEALFRKDIENNRSIGDHGAEWLAAQVGLKPGETLSVLTHCNTGSLATSGHGTALGIIRSLRDKKLLRHAFCTETRPYNQGSRLTAFELVFENIPSTLITDSMAGALFSRRKDEMNIAAVIVGADRVVRNGDTANKIGTYALAVLARYHGIKFIVAAPTTSIDLETETGEDITIEERKKEELTRVTGAVVNPDGSIDSARKVTVATADQRIGVWNPAFDVTPHHLIDAIVTEHAVVVKDESGKFNLTR